MDPMGKELSRNFRVPAGSLFVFFWCAGDNRTLHFPKPSVVLSEFGDLKTIILRENFKCGNYCNYHHVWPYGSI